MKRRQFIALLGGAALAWPLVARAQQSGMVIGFLGAPTEASYVKYTAAIRQGMSESGYVEGRNVTFEYRWAEGGDERYSELVADLIRAKVSVIVTGANTPASLAAKAATSTIPIVFGVSDDPVKLGLVASLARPGGNATGVNFLIAELGTKRFGLLREMVPTAARVAVLVDPGSTALADATVRDAQTAAAVFGMQVRIFNGATIGEIDAAFANIAREQVDALYASGSPFFNSRRVQLAIQAARHAIPATYPSREYAAAGGLMSYGTSLPGAYRQIGAYAGRILKGEKPADLPVVQSTHFELVINLSAARALGLEVPPTLIARADEVIE